MTILVRYGGHNGRPAGLCTRCRIFTVRPPDELCRLCQARAEQRKKPASIAVA